jgi:16S rRNA (guanine966-N2)-methyltransferase
VIRAEPVELAVRTAAAIVAEHGIDASGPRVLSTRQAVIVHFAPAPLVARVGVEEDFGPRLLWQHGAIRVVQHLAEAGAAVVPPSNLLPPGPYERDGIVLSFWYYVEEETGRQLAPAAVGEALASGSLIDRCSRSTATPTSGTRCRRGRGRSLTTVRIIAGSRKGARIFTPPGDTRPTGDRVREAAFNLIGPVDGASVLDLFAGSGALGLEALSRAAERAVFVESDRVACRTIERNLEKLGLTGATVLCRDALKAIAAEAAAGRRYDLVLADPPYEMFSHLQTALAAYLPAVLAENGLVVVETDARTEPQLPLAKRTSRRYGSARLTLFEHP